MKPTPCPVVCFRFLVLPAALLVLTLAPCHAAEASDAARIQLENAWIAEAPPLSKVMAGYMKIQNPGKQPVAIEKITSADFSSIEIHRSVEKDGIARMERQDGINIAAGSQFELAPGGYHLMMFKPKKPFHAGDRSQLIFTFVDGNSAAFDVVVKKASDYLNNGHH
jgi:hypothetical protein